MDGASFFHPKQGEREGTGGPNWAREGGVLLLADCRAHVLQIGELFGIWGGLSEEDRHPLGSTMPSE